MKDKLSVSMLKTRRGKKNRDWLRVRRWWKKFHGKRQIILPRQSYLRRLGYKFTSSRMVMKLIVFELMNVYDFKDKY